MTESKDVKNWTEQSGKVGTAGRARTKEQYQMMIEAEKEGNCLFCAREKWERQPFQESNHWMVKENDFPYEHHKIHWVIIWKPGHLEDIHQVPLEAWLELGRLLQSLKESHALPSINFVMRFGDPDLRSSTIHHLHGHVQIPTDDVVPENAPPIISIEDATQINSFLDCIAIDDPGPVHHQVRKVLLISNDAWETKDSFPILMLCSLDMIEELSIQGGGIVFRMGDRRYTNGRFANPYVTIYAPDGTGRVHATFVPALVSDKPICKATFCKGFKGEELEKLSQRMKKFAL